MVEKTVTVPSEETEKPFETIPDGAKKYTEVSKIELWKKRIRVAKKVRAEELKDIKLLIAYYEGNQWWHEDGSPVLEDRTTVNLIFANIKNEMPYLYFQNPTPVVNETRKEFELSAFASQELLKYYTKENLGSSLKSQVRLSILDAKFSFGCCKVLYTPTFESNPNTGDPIHIGDDDFGDPIFLTDEEGNLVGQSNNILVSELYSVERIDARDMLIDPECKNSANKAKWFAHEIIKPLEYMKGSKLYKNTKNLQGNVELKDDLRDQDEEKTLRELDETRVQFYEIHDIENGEILVVSEQHDEFLREDKSFINPFVFLKFNERPDKFYPLPDVRIEKPLQQQINVGESQMMTHARRASRKYYYDQNTFKDEIQLDNAKSSEDMSFFEIQEYDKPPKPLEIAPQDPSIFQLTQMSKMNFHEVTSSTEAERGVTERRKTKGEASYQEGHSLARRTDKQSLVADFIKEIYITLLKLMQNTLTKQQAVKVIGKTGEFWVEIGRDDIKGEFFVDVEVADLRPQIPEVEKQELNEFMFALSNLLNSIVSNPIMPQVINIQGMIKELAKGYPMLKVENLVNMAITPEQIAELAMQQNQAQNTAGGSGGNTA